MFLAIFAAIVTALSPLSANEQMTGVKLSDHDKAPEITGIDNWMNSPPLSLAKLRGKVVLVDFWSYSSIDSKRVLPHLRQLYEDYGKNGLVIIGVHTPEFVFERDRQNVTDAVSRLELKYPIAQDNDSEAWEAFGVKQRPTRYLIDQAGNIRLVQVGEGGYVQLENAIRKLFDLPPVDKKEVVLPKRRLTDEIYLGWFRGNRYTRETRIVPDKTESYRYKVALGIHRVGLRGDWTVRKDRITSESDNSYLDLHFLARQVYLVMSGSSKTPMEVYLDGKLDKKIIVDGAREYTIIDTAYGRHQLSLRVPKGIRAYAFTFGDEK